MVLLTHNMKILSLSLILLTFLLSTKAQNGIDVPEMANCDNLVTQFMNTHGIPGATFAMAKNGKLVYMRSFGHADLDKTEDTHPHHLFRIASISKPITSIAIMKLVEGGSLALSDKVFGTGGLLENHPSLASVMISDQRIYDITVQQLLEHSAGWNRDLNCVPSPTSPYPWAAGHCDPIGFPLHVTQLLGEANPVTEPMLIRFLLEKGLDFAPGSQYAYSNIGYLVLGEVIESVSGKSYEDYVKDEILSPIGICDMHIGRNLRENKVEREGEYFGNGYQAPSLYGTGQNVPWEYGGWNLEAMDAHGGWIATARDLVRLLTAVDGFATKPDILSNSSISTMTTGSSVNAFYAKGWSVNTSNNWWHTGALDGTASLWARSNNGYTWAIILNKRVIDGTSNQFWSDLDGLPWNCISQTSTWPSHDLFQSPSLSASSIAFEAENETSLKVSWVPGNGTGRILVGKAGSPVDGFPLDGQNYTGDSDFGAGENLGNDNFVLYNGTQFSETISGLDPNKTYHFRVFEYTQNSLGGNHALYKLCDATTDSISVNSVGIDEDLVETGISMFPNPTNGMLAVNLPDGISSVSLSVYSLYGQHVFEAVATNTSSHLDLSHLPAQTYLVIAFVQGKPVGRFRLEKQD